jgi:hypothetical protein
LKKANGYIGKLTPGNFLNRENLRMEKNRSALFVKQFRRCKKQILHCTGQMLSMKTKLLITGGSKNLEIEQAKVI